MTIDDRAWSAREAEEIAVHGHDPNTGKATTIILLDTHNEVAQEIDRDLAKALALRLLDLADDLPEPGRDIRRPVGVDDLLRDLDG